MTNAASAVARVATACRLRADVAAVAVSPADAHPDALEVADRGVSSTREGGWAEILDLV